MLPPKGDPRRPLHLAVRSARVLGILFVLIGLCGTLPAVLGLRGAGGLNGPLMATTVLGIGVLLLYLGPGICYLVFASYLSNYRRWAVTAALILAALHTLLIVLGIVAIALRIVASGPDVRSGILPLAIAMLVLLAMGQMIYHLVLSYESVKHRPFGRESYEGFTPIFPTDRQPPPPSV
jgi:hypothetical protein